MDANLIYSDLKFRHTWRPYQQRVLNAIDQHLLDRKLHIVAAPGSGKTTLGLEIFRRLRKPALVLSPTRTIRDQWIHRLRDFVSDTTAWSYDWTSTDLSKPAIFTSVTYQALHSHYRDNDNTAQEQEGSEDNRLKLPYLDGQGRITKSSLKNLANNDYVVDRLRRIDEISARWKNAIETGEASHVTPTVKIVTPLTVAPIWFKRTLKYLLLQIVASFLIIFGNFFAPSIQSAASTDRPMIFFMTILISGAAATAYVFPRLVKAFWIFLKHLPVDGTVQQIALAVRDSLCATDLILGSPSRFPVVTTRHEDGSVSISLTSGSFYERSLFADCVNEILGPIRNPRYLLTRYRSGNTSGRRDYHAVPQPLGAKKISADILQQAWLRRVGPTELIYVRGPDGRRELLKARSKAFSTSMQNLVERLDRWH